MAIILGIVAVVLVLAIWIKPKREATQVGGHEPTNKYPYDMSWPEPKADDLWDSFDFFVRLGEVRARNTCSFDEETVSLFVYVSDCYSKKRGYFELRTLEFEASKDSYHEIPYLRNIELPFVGYDPDSSLLTMEESEIRSLIMGEAKHAARISIQKNDVYMHIAIKFNGIL